MKQGVLGGVVLLTLLVGSGCESHLVFVENEHWGLKASFEPNNPSPAELDVGWRRAMVAMVPQKSAGGSKATGAAPSGSVTVDRTPGGKTNITVVPDPDELMSMYSVYRGNIGFADPIEIYHFLATGVAASSLLANDDSLRDLVEKVAPAGAGGKQ